MSSNVASKYSIGVSASTGTASHLRKPKLSGEGVANACVRSTTRPKANRLRTTHPDEDVTEHRLRYHLRWLPLVSRPGWHHQQRFSPAPRSSVASRRARGQAMAGRRSNDEQAAVGRGTTVTHTGWRACYVHALLTTELTTPIENPTDDLLWWSVSISIY